MEEINKIVYSNENDSLVSESLTEKVVVKFLEKLSPEDLAICNTLKDYCKTLITTELVYIVYKADTNTLNVQQKEGENPNLIVSELPPLDKAKVDAVGLMCTELLNQ